MYSKRIYLFCYFLWLLPCLLAAQLNVITTAVPFLGVTPEPIADAMAGTSMGTRPDVNAIFYNPAKLIFAPNKLGFTACYTPWMSDLGISDVSLITTGGYLTFNNNKQAVSCSMRYFNLGNIQFTDILGNPITSTNPYEYALDISYAHKIIENLSLAVSLRYIYSKLAAGTINNNTYEPAKTVASDIALFQHFNNENGAGWSWGLAITNIGPKLDYTNNGNKSFLPTNLEVGASYIFVPEQNSEFTLALDASKLLVPTPPTNNDGDAWRAYNQKSPIAGIFTSFVDAGSIRNEVKHIAISIGGEYLYHKRIAFRMGYYYEDEYLGNRTHFTFGIGLFTAKSFAVNCSYNAPAGNTYNRNPLSNSLRFGVSYFFDDRGR